MNISLVFLVAGIIIMTGFFGIFFFDKTKIPDVLLLMGIGILLGPVSGLIDPSGLRHFTEYFGTLALIVILFEGGMDMDIDRLLKEFGIASFLVVVSFTLSTIAIASYLHLVQQWELLRSILLGTILGCTSAAIVIPIVGKMDVKDETKTLLSVESALSDVLAVVISITLIEIITLGTIGIRTPFRTVASSFSTAIIGGAVAGVFWLKVLDYLKDKRYSYMFTLAAVLITYGVLDFLGGSGSIAVLVFGIILGNSHSFSKILNISDDSLVESTIKFFHGEMTFFIRTFFFVYLGLIISFSDLNFQFFLVSGALFLIIIVARYLSVMVTVKTFSEKRGDRFFLFSMMPRGLASAVLAILPVSANVTDSEKFIDITFAVIILTNILMTFGVFFSDKVTQRTSVPLSEQDK
ncbi:MAG: cation:proton antiporter [Geobacteraceae bacterium]